MYINTICFIFTTYYLTKITLQMTVQEIANRLVELSRLGDYETIYKELFSPDAVSIEPKGAPMELVEGLEAIYKKGEMFQSMVQEMHSSFVGDPIVAGDHFSCTMGMEITYKGAPGPSKEEEICLYKVANGKIVKEQFFYTVVQR